MVDKKSFRLCLRTIYSSSFFHMEIMGGAVAGRDIGDRVENGQSECFLFLLLLQFSDIVVSEELTLRVLSVLSLQATTSFLGTV